MYQNQSLTCVFVASVFLLSCQLDQVKSTDVSGQGMDENMPSSTHLLKELAKFRELLNKKHEFEKSHKLMSQALQQNDDSSSSQSLASSSEDNEEEGDEAHEVSAGHDNDELAMSKKNAYLRFGKRSGAGPAYLRFGRAGQAYLRFGKRNAPAAYLRFGKRNPAYLRFGK